MNLIFEKASPEDRNGILHLSSLIWEGEDYIPQIIDKWLSSTDPLMVGKDGDGNIAAVDHAAFFGNAALMEGLRVDPAYHNRGIGKKIYLEMLREVLKRKPSLVYQIVWNDNPSSLNLAGKYNFHTACKFFMLEYPIKIKPENLKPPKTVSMISPLEISQMLSEFESFLMASAGFIPDGWAAYPSVDFLENRFIFESRGKKIIAGINSHEKEMFSICLFSEPGEWLKDILPEIINTALYLKCNRIHVDVPYLKRDWAHAFINAGFLKMWDYETTSLENTIIYLMVYNFSKSDSAVIPKQLEIKEKKLDNLYGVKKRCSFGFPSIIESFPLKERKPFPTLYYLTCPYLRREISKLEEKGLISEFSSVMEKPEYSICEAAYREIRKERLVRNLISEDFTEKFSEAFEKGIGGIEEGNRSLKCLHLHYATFEAGLNDPAGRMVSDYLSKNSIPPDCCEIECFDYLEF